MTSSAKTVEEYLEELPADRRDAIQAVRKVILDHLPQGYEERMIYGMIGYVVPHGLYPAGYHCDPKLPLTYLSLASQKNHMALYMMCFYGNDKQQAWFRQAYADTGKKLDAGKACIRFKKLDDLALDVIGEAVGRLKPEEYIANYESALPAAKRAR